MQQKILNILNKIKDKWSGIDNSGKVKIIISAVVVIVALAVVIRFATRPNRVAVYSGLTHTVGMDGQAVLREAGIDSVFSEGEIRVLEADADIAGYTLANSSLSSLNDPEITFANALNLLKMGSTTATQEAVFLHAEQQRISNQMRMFEFVDSAQVTLVIPKDRNAFYRGTEKATASVTLVTNRELTSREGQALARFLCKSVKGLSMEDIEIVDQSVNTIYSGMQQESDGYSDLYELEMTKKTEIEKMIRGYFYGIFDEVNIILNLDVNTIKEYEQSRIVTNPNPEGGSTGLVQRETTSSSRVEGGSGDDAVGMDANDQAAPTYETGNQSATNASTKDSQVEYLYGETTTSKDIPVGTINYENSAIAIKLIKKNLFHEEDLPQLLQDAGLPENTTWRGFQNGIDEYALIPANPELTNLQTTIQSGSKIADVSLIAYEQSVFIDNPAPPVRYQDYVILAILALLILLLLYGVIKKTQQDEITEVEPELSVEDLLVSTQFEEDKEAEVERLQEIAFNQQSEAMKQIENFITERPDAVAQLLRNWMNEDWE